MSNLDARQQALEAFAQFVPKPTAAVVEASIRGPTRNLRVPDHSRGEERSGHRDLGSERL